MTQQRDTLLELAERVERRDGPDRELDGWIWAHMTRGQRYIIGQKEGRFPRDPIYGERLDVMQQMTADPKGAADYIGSPKFTASLDAAMSLIPDGFAFSVGRCDDGVTCWAGCSDSDMHMASEDIEEGFFGGDAATPALALVAASLKALASQQDNQT